ncbi:efflux ABC transporter permease [Clostridia bacterium]|nr:efflux ABC transporter permease [Clostridia bacterium]
MINVANKRTIRTLAFRQIKAGKARNFFAIAAIMLTSVLVTAVLSMGAGLMDANRQMLMKSSGQKSEVSVQYLTEDEAERVAAHPLIKEYGLTRFIARADEGVWSLIPVEIKTMDLSYADFTFSTPTTGRLPESENEVAVKSWMLEKLGLPRELGQTFPLSFKIGNTRHELTLTVCGIWDDDYYLHPYGTATISDALADSLLVNVNPAETRLNGEYSGITQLYANLNGRQADLQSNLDRLISETGLDAKLTAPYVGYAYTNTELDAGSVVAIVFILLIVMVSGYLLIYNIFYISVIRDIKHYGLLKTVGTTKPQIKRVVNVQALALCLVGIPLGLLLGYFLAVVLFPFFLTATTLNGNIGMATPNPIVFAAAALLSLITVFISCNHPARIAGKISPVEATRYAGISSGQKKKTKSGYNGAKVGRMAFANLFRSRKKTVITLASVSFGLILFNIVFTFTNSFDVNKTLKHYIHGDFLIASDTYLNIASTYLNPAYALTEETLETVSQLDGITNIAEVYYKVTQGYQNEVDTPVPAQVHGMDSYWLDTLKDSVVEGMFDRQKFLSGDYAVVVADEQNLWGVGDTITINPGDGTESKSYEIMAKIDYNSMLALSARFLTLPGVSVYLPESELKDRAGVDIMSATVFADNSKLAQINAEIGATVAGIPNLNFRSRTDYAEEMNNNNRQFALVGLSLCLVVLLIGLLNFVNTTMTNIISRKYEFAMLQAIGMTARQSRNMLTLEGLYFVLITGAVFVSVGYAASFGIVRMLTENTAAYTYHFTILPLMITLPVLCLIAVVLPRLAYRGISKNSVVERLREIA